MKKKTIAAFGLFAVSAVLILIHSASANAQLLDQSFSVNALASSLKTPQDIARYMWKNFSFETDRRQFGAEDYWQSPEEFMKNRRGDCEDFARFAYEVLKQNGLNAFILNLYGGRYAHTVCILKKDGLYYVFDSSKLKKYKASSLQELSSKIYSFWEKGAIVTPDSNHRAVILSELTK